MRALTHSELTEVHGGGFWSTVGKIAFQAGKAAAQTAASTIEEYGVRTLVAIGTVKTIEKFLGR